MKRRGFKLFRGLLFGTALLSFFACSDDGAPGGKGEVDFEITDAPSDDASIKSVMVTVAEIKVDGQSISGFTKQTIDLKAYQEGNTKFLGSTELDSKTYSNITLVLDLDSDANGNTPGCYVLTQDNMKYKLKSSSSGKANVVINKTWKVTSDIKNKIVLDFDLRKSIGYSEDPSQRYAFVSENNLNAAVRLISRDKSGSIKGSYEDEAGVNAEKVIVYVYKKGTFNATTESQAQSSDNIYFKNAVASAEVKESLTGKTFILAFLEEGEYEIVYTAYNKNSDTGRYSFTGRLQSETTVNGSLGNIVKVYAGASLNISSSIKGII